ncbi:hypothetical protein K438DRAFT_1976097 [Mycena galopus ATCC 62051]|nr:hypothetical protein K438DRAFT_1976097 [Mycena galopus ATCC 62051]
MPLALSFNDDNWTNDCAHWTDLTAGKCYTLDAGHQNSISSFGPDEGIFCDLYTDYHCKNECISIYYPGEASLNFNGGDGGQDCNDRVNSFACWVIPT